MIPVCFSFKHILIIIMILSFIVIILARIIRAYFHIVCCLVWTWIHDFRYGPGWDCSLCEFFIPAVVIFDDVCYLSISHEPLLYSGWVLLCCPAEGSYCTGVGCCPLEQTVPESSDISVLYLEPPTAVTVCCLAVIRMKQEVLSNYVIIKKVKHSVAESPSVT